MLFVKTDDLRVGMRLAKPIYNKNGVMLYERDSKLSNQGIVSIQNFGLIGVYILEPAEPVPPMSEDDIEFERFQAMAIFSIKEILDLVASQKEPKGLYPFINQVIKKYGSLYHKINFVQNIRSADDYCYKHALNVAILCALITKKLDYDFKKQLDVVVAGLIHDVGSLLIPKELRRLTRAEITEEDYKKITTYHFAGYQILNRAYDLEPSVKRNATVACKELFNIGEPALDKRLEEVEIIEIAAIFDDMTAMKFGEEPLSEIAAIKHLMNEDYDFNQTIVKALIDSINLLQPGVCVELTDGSKGLVIAEGAMNVLEPFVLSFKDNVVLNLADTYVSREVQIKDIMKTMDNRHVVDNNLLQQYIGSTVHIGEKKAKKNY